MNDLITIVISAIFGGAAGAFLYNTLHNWGINRRVSALEAALFKEQQTRRGAKGNEAQAQLKERQQAAIIEGLTAVKGGAKIEDVLKDLLAKYPDVAGSIFKELGV